MNLSSPFDWVGTKGILGMPRVVGVVFGVLFIVLGILILIYFYPKSKQGAKNYKDRQLIEWKKINPKRTLAKYSDTKMFLPAWEKVKLMAPVIICLTLCIMGLAWIVGNTLNSL